MLIPELPDQKALLLGGRIRRQAGELVKIMEIAKTI